MYLSLSALVAAASVLSLCSAAPPATNTQSLSPTANPECICTFDYNPVCADGKTYPNACTAICYGASLGYFGPCKDPQPANSCVCPLVYLPVCGDGKMYVNFCEALCEWAQSITPGQCPELPEPKTT